MRLDGRVAVVTGGTYGVGGGVARELVAQGARVHATGRSAPDGQPMAERLFGVRCDHRDDEQVQAALGRILQDGPIARRRGLIVNISFWAAQKYVGNAAYGVSKAATDKLTA